MKVAVVRETRKRIRGVTGAKSETSAIPGEILGEIDLLAAALEVVE